MTHAWDLLTQLELKSNKTGRDLDPTVAVCFSLNLTEERKRMSEDTTFRTRILYQAIRGTNSVRIFSPTVAGKITSREFRKLCSVREDGEFEFSPKVLKLPSLNSDQPVTYLFLGCALDDKDVPITEKDVTAATLLERTPTMDPLERIVESKPISAFLIRIPERLATVHLIFCRNIGDVEDKKRQAFIRYQRLVGRNENISWVVIPTAEVFYQALEWETALTILRYASTIHPASSLNNPDDDADYIPERETPQWMQIVASNVLTERLEDVVYDIELQRLAHKEFTGKPIPGTEEE